MWENVYLFVFQILQSSKQRTTLEFDHDSCKKKKKRRNGFLSTVILSIAYFQLLYTIAPFLFMGYNVLIDFECVKLQLKENWVNLNNIKVKISHVMQSLEKCGCVSFSETPKSLWLIVRLSASMSTTLCSAFLAWFTSSDHVLSTGELVMKRRWCESTGKPGFLIVHAIISWKSISAFSLIQILAHYVFLNCTRKWVKFGVYKHLLKLDLQYRNLMDSCGYTVWFFPPV